MVKTNIKVLVVDSDPVSAALTVSQLNENGIETLVAENAETALELINTAAPAAVISEVILSGMDGLQFCREIRGLSGIPFIFVSEKNDVFDRVLGLEMGADDYVGKPFDVRELVARVKVAVRRSRNENQNERKKSSIVDGLPINFPGLEIDKSTYQVKVDGNVVDMPPKELQLLYMLASDPNKVFTRDQLLERIWGYDFFGNSRTVDVHIKRLREKIENGNDHPWSIDTVWGVGYKFVTKENED